MTMTSEVKLEPPCRRGSPEWRRKISLAMKGTNSRLRHGMARHGRETPTWLSWRSMHGRTTYPGDRKGNYAARGITVCERWRSFENFLEDMGERPSGTTLDRVDVNGNYEPGNCRWATTTQQARNRRKMRLNFALAVEITLARLRGEACASIAARVGISKAAPSAIAAGRYWADASQLAHQIFSKGNGDV